MPDSKSKDSNEEPNQDSIDLSDLKSFSFGTQWTAASKGSPDSSRSRYNKGGSRSGDRPDRRPGGGGSPARKDRRPPRPTRKSDESGDAPNRDFQSGQGQREQYGRRQNRRGPRHEQFKPYESSLFDVCFYPDDSCFSAIIKAMRGNHLTYELFHVAKLFMEKPDRFIASITRKAAEGQKPEKVFICTFDNMPFATEEEVINHVMTHHASEVFSIEEIEVEPPSGNFPFVNRCPFTKELLGPPNYHKYETALQNHHRTRLPNMSFEKLQSSIETVREEEVVAEWLETQKKATRYTTKTSTEEEEAKEFKSIEDAMTHLRTELKTKVLKQVNYARVSGSILEKYADSEAFKAMDGERQRQQRFPLDTANAIRGRMRREKFSIYKKGAKGVTYVCSTKRNFRTPGQVMSPDLDRIIRFVESNQSIKSKEMATAYEAWLKTDAEEASFDEKKMQRDLHWLIADGYISHFEDDSLFAQPVLESGSRGDEGKKAKKPSKPTEEKKPDAIESPVTTVESEPKPEGEISEKPAVEEQPAAEEKPTVEEQPVAEEKPAVEVDESEVPKIETPVSEVPTVEAVLEESESKEAAESSEPTKDGDPEKA